MSIDNPILDLITITTDLNMSDYEEDMFEMLKDHILDGEYDHFVQSFPESYVNKRCGSRNSTLLMIAVHYKRINIIKHIISYEDTDPNVGDYHGMTAFHQATFACHNNSDWSNEYDEQDLEILRILMTDNRIDYSLVGNDGISYLHNIAGKKNVPMELIQNIFSSGLDVNCVAGSGNQTPLHTAFYEQQVPMIETLVHHPDINREEVTKYISLCMTSIWVKDVFNALISAMNMIEVMDLMIEYQNYIPHLVKDHVLICCTIDVEREYFEENIA